MPKSSQTAAVLSARAEAVKDAKNTPKRSIVGELHKKQTIIQNDSLRRTKDIDALRAEGKNEAYIHKVKITNLQQAAKARVLFDCGFESYEDLDAAIVAAQTKMHESYAAHKAFDGKIADKKEFNRSERTVKTALSELESAEIFTLHGAKSVHK